MSTQIENYIPDTINLLQQPEIIQKTLYLINGQFGNYDIYQNYQLFINQDNQLEFSELIEQLKCQNLSLINSLIYLYDKFNNKFVPILAEAYPAKKFIPYTHFQNEEFLFIFYKPQQQIIQKACSMNLEDHNQNQYMINGDQPSNPPTSEELDKILKEFLSWEYKNASSFQMNPQPREQRVKERTIGYVKDKVDKWRSFYLNPQSNNKDGTYKKINLDEAADYVGLSRKTLDDYYAQIKKGQELGFNFELNKNQKMGLLRKFVKEKWQDKIQQEASAGIRRKYQRIKKNKQEQGQDQEQSLEFQIQSKRQIESQLESTQNQFIREECENPNQEKSKQIDSLQYNQQIDDSSYKQIEDNPNLICKEYQQQQQLSLQPHNSNISEEEVKCVNVSEKKPILKQIQPNFERQYKKPFEQNNIQIEREFNEKLIQRLPNSRSLSPANELVQNNTQHMNLENLNNNDIDQYLLTDQEIIGQYNFQQTP